jgi:hypothetical protein
VIFHSLIEVDEQEISNVDFKEEGEEYILTRLHEWPWLLLIEHKHNIECHGHVLIPESVKSITEIDDQYRFEITV